MAERNLLLRVLSALVGLPLIGFVVFWREPLGLAILTCVVGTAALAEYVALTVPSSSGRLRWLVVVAGLGLLVGLIARPELAHAWFVAAIVLTALASLTSPQADTEAGARAFGATVAGVVYIAGPLAAIPLLHAEPFGSYWVATALAVTFANDTGAYFAGRALGRHKLAPSISPGKTVEGAIGGLVAGVLVLWIGSLTVFPALGLQDVIVIGVAAGIFGPAGDLVESLLKRAAGAKDSGRSIPGHGGVLDRIDALLFVVAFVYFYVELLR